MFSPTDLMAFIAAVLLPLALYVSGALIGVLLAMIVIAGAYNALHKE